MLKVVRDLYDPDEEGFAPTLFTFSSEECAKRIAEIYEDNKLDDDTITENLDIEHNKTCTKEMKNG